MLCWEGEKGYFALSGNVEKEEEKEEKEKKKKKAEASNILTTTYIPKGSTGSVSDVVIGHGPIQKIFAVPSYHPLRFNWPL